MSVRVADLVDRKIEEIKESLTMWQAIREMISRDPNLINAMTSILLSPEINGKMTVRQPTPMPIQAGNVTPATLPINTGSQPVTQVEPSTTDPRTPAPRRYRLDYVLDYFKSKPAGHWAGVVEIAEGTGLDKNNLYHLLANPTHFESGFGEDNIKHYRLKAQANS